TITLLLIVFRLQKHTTEKSDRPDLNSKDNTKQWKRCCFHKFITSSCYEKDVTEMISLAIQTVTNISVWEKAVSFLGSLPAPLKQVNWKPDYKGSYTKEEEATGQLQKHTTEKSDRPDLNSKDNTKQWKRCCFHKFITSSCYEKDVTEMISLEIDDMLIIRSKKIIKFRLGGRAHSLILLEFARRLGLYQALELEKDGFNVYFKGCLRSDDNFNITDYWFNIGHEENLSLSRSHTFTIKRLILRVIHKIITYGLCQRTTGYDNVQKNDLWLLSMVDARHQNGYANVAWVITKWIKRKGAGTQKDSQICCGQFILKLARKCRPPKASMQDLYDRMGRMEICQEAIEHMEEPTTLLVTLSRNMTSTISIIHLHHHSTNHSISSSRMMTSSIEMKRVCRDRKTRVGLSGGGDGIGNGGYGIWGSGLVTSSDGT
nr:hypothetical protein [Tanacetum cinerariifolium]